MTTYISVQNSGNRPSASSGWAKDVKSAFGTYEWGAVAQPTIADTVVMCKLPKGALIIGGLLFGDKIETTSVGSGLFSINIGLDKAATLPSGTTLNAASASNALASNWVLGTDTLALPGTQWYGSAARAIPLGALLLTEGPLLTSDETNVIITVGASCQAITTGTMGLRVDYYQAQHS